MAFDYLTEINMWKLLQLMINILQIFLCIPGIIYKWMIWISSVLNMNKNLCIHSIRINVFPYQIVFDLRNYIIFYHCGRGLWGLWLYAVYIFSGKNTAISVMLLNSFSWLFFSSLQMSLKTLKERKIIQQKQAIKYNFTLKKKNKGKRCSFPCL